MTSKISQRVFLIMLPPSFQSCLGQIFQLHKLIKKITHFFLAYCLIGFLWGVFLFILSFMDSDIIFFGSFKITS